MKLNIEEPEHKQSDTDLGEFRYQLIVKTIDDKKLAHVLAVLEANIDSFQVWDADTKRTKKIVSVSMNRDAIQFNVERFE